MRFSAPAKLPAPQAKCRGKILQDQDGRRNRDQQDGRRNKNAETKAARRPFCRFVVQYCTASDGREEPKV